MADKNSLIDVNGVRISIISKNNEDYISLTNMTTSFEGGSKLIEKWLSNKSTVEFLGVWERIHNPSFNSPEFGGIYQETGSNRFYLSVKQFIEKTAAIGLIAKAGRYGGTYAHKDIAYHFGMWLSPEFNLLVLKEFQRLKEEEIKYLKSPEWLHRRFLTKVNYKLHTDAIKQFVIPQLHIPKDKEKFVYASEAELLNMAVFGITSNEWELANPDKAQKGENIRDNASAIELLALNSIQIVNRELLKQGLSPQDRLISLSEIAREHMISYFDNPIVRRDLGDSLSDTIDSN